MTDPKLPPASPVPPIQWGLWLPNKGWWKTQRKSDEKIGIFSTIDKPTAETYARIIGARVRQIDASLIEFENDIRAIEKERSLKQRIKRTWASMTNSKNSSK
jgi:hypothetical protein